MSAIVVEVVTDGPERGQVAELWREYMRLTFEEVAELLPAESRSLPDELPDEATDPVAHYPLVLLGRLDGEPVASAGLELHDGATAEVKRLYVRAPARRRGIARAMVQRAIAEARGLGASRLVVETLPTRAGALRLFRSLGFVETEPFRDFPFDMVFLAVDTRPSHAIGGTW